MKILPLTVLLLFAKLLIFVHNSISLFFLSRQKPTLYIPSTRSILIKASLHLGGTISEPYRPDFDGYNYHDG
jgi:hypothetical protein